MTDIFPQIGGLLFSALIAAVILEWATKMVAGFTPRFWKVFVAALCAQTVSWAFGVFAAGLFEIDASLPTLAWVPLVVLGIGSTVVIYSQLITDSAGDSIGIRNGLWVTLIQFGVEAAVFGGLYLLTHLLF